MKLDGYGIGIQDDVISTLEPNDDNDLLDVRFSENVTVTSLFFLKFGTGDFAQINFGRDGPNTILNFGGNATELGSFDVFVTNFDDIHFTGNGYSLAAIGLNGYVPEPSSITLMILAMLGFGLKRRCR